MPRRDFTQYMPTEVVTQLHSWLIESNFTGYENHALRLSKMGYPVSKSAIHRVGEKLQKELQVETELRMRCVESASRLTTPDQVLEKAEEILLWVKSGRIAEPDIVS